MSERKLGLVPRLRFPEFREVGEWKKKMLGDFLAYLQPTNYLVRSTEYDDSYQTPVLTAGKTFVLGYTNEKTGIFDKNLPVIIFDDFTTASKFVDFPFKAKSSAMKILLAKKSANIKFIFESMQIIKYEVGDHKRHWISIFEKLPVPIPPRFEEQQKIAACLSSLDALITAQADKLNALKTYKNGLMQQLFPREGATIPRLRFPEFQEAGEWCVKQLGDISDIKTGPFGSVLHESDYVEAGTPIITVEHLGETKIEGENAPKVSDSDKKRLGSYILEDGDIVFSRVGSVDRCAIVRETEKGWLFSGRLLRLRVISTDNSALFLNQLLKHEPNKAQIRNSAVGQTMASLNTAILKSISLPFPSAPEQQKIADCLSSLDALIAAHTDKLDALKTHKRGLIQQLFPSPDADIG